MPYLADPLRQPMASQERHSAIYMVGRVLPALINLSSTAIFTRLASPEAYSTYVISYASAQIGSALFFQWLRQSLLRFSPTANRQIIVGTIGSLYALQACLVIALSVIAALLSGVKIGPLILVCAALTLGQAWFDLAQELQRMQMQSKRYGLLFFVRSVCGLTLGTIALALTGSGFWLTFAVLVSFLAPPFPFIWGFLSHLSFDRALMRRVMAYGGPLILSTTFSTAGMVGDRLVVAYLMDSGSAGQYGPAVDIARQAIFVLVQGIALAGYPLAIRALEAGDLRGATEQMRKNIELLLFIAIPATAGLISVSNHVSNILLGEEYQEAARLLLPAAASASLVMCIRTFYLDQAIQLGKRTGLQVVTSASIVASFLATAFITIPRLGLMGACFALLSSQLVGAILSWLLGRRHFALPFPGSTLLRVLVATSSMVASIQALRLTSWAGGEDALALSLLVLVGAVVYGASVLAMNVLNLRTYAARIIFSRNKL